MNGTLSPVPWRSLGLSALGALTLAVGVGVWNALHFETNHYRLRVRGLKRPLRLVQLSDLHVGLYVTDAMLADWVDTTLRLKPDLILITGDLSDSREPRHVQMLLRHLSRLRAPLGVYASLGNHDYYGFDDMDEFDSILEACGIKLLINEGLPLRPDLYLAAVDDLWQGEPDIKAALEDRPRAGATLVMCHNPDVLPEIPADVDLTLSGHTHGGQIRIPGYGPLVETAEHGRVFNQGWVRAPARAYISRGLGTSLMPVRLNCNAELVVMDLAPAGNP